MNIKPKAMFQSKLLLRILNSALYAITLLLLMALYQNSSVSISWVFVLIFGCLSLSKVLDNHSYKKE